MSDLRDHLSEWVQFQTHFKVLHSADNLLTDTLVRALKVHASKLKPHGTYRVLHISLSPGKEFSRILADALPGANVEHRDSKQVIPNAKYHAVILEGTLETLDAQARDRVMASIHKALEPNGALIWAYHHPESKCFVHAKNAVHAVANLALLATGKKSRREVEFVEGMWELARAARHSSHSGLLSAFQDDSAAQRFTARWADENSEVRATQKLVDMQARAPKDEAEASNFMEKHGFVLGRERPPSIFELEQEQALHPYFKMGLVVAAKPAPSSPQHARGRPTPRE